MASIYTREGSRFYWVKYRDPVTRKIKRESTKFLVISKDGKLGALREAAAHSFRELETPRSSEHELWQAWVPAFLNDRYKDSPKTLSRANNAWAAILAFLTEKKLVNPRMVDYAAVNGYLPWRAGKTGLRVVKHNTAVLEIKFFSVILREAVRRGFTVANACRELEVARVPAKRKEEITDEDQKIIEAALKDAPRWMGEHWLFLMRMGARCSEAFTPLSEIDEHEGTIRMKIKGGGYHTAPLHEDLVPLVALARKEKRKRLIEPPEYAPKRWHTFLKKLRDKSRPEEIRLSREYSLHCTRVTVITRLLRKGYTPAQVCAYVGHSEDVNVIYRRLRPSDVRQLGAALGAVPIPLKSMPDSETEERQRAS